MSLAYYNEIDPKAAAWLRELIKEGHIAPGEVDVRSIEDVKPSDLRGFAQCHFFAGIGGWSCALRLAGWSDDRAVWTGSCPCQPFSMAGKGGGVADERHLWPAFFHLIEQCKPSVVFGEQVASKDGLGWLDIVQADLEGVGYTSAAVDICAAGIGAPHVRQRLWLVADATSQRQQRRPAAGHNVATEPVGLFSCGSSVHAGVLADASGAERQRDRRVAEPSGITESTDAGELGNAGSAGTWGNSGIGVEPEAGLCGARYSDGGERYASRAPSPAIELGHPTSDGWPWRATRGRESRIQPAADTWACEWLPCTDGKARPVEPGTFPLAHGVPGRVGLLRGYGNAIVPQVAAAFIEAYVATRLQRFGELDA